MSALSSTTCPTATGKMPNTLGRFKHFGESLVAALAILPLILGLGTVRAESAEPAFAVLVFSKTAAYRHDSIASGIGAIRALGNFNNFRVDASEDAGLFTDQNLAKYRAVIFLNTSGTILDREGKAAFERFIQRGGGFVGVHSASDTEYDWPWYEGLVGTYFHKHPAIQSATLRVVDASHGSTRPLPIDWTRTDEWYNFRRDLDPGITVLIRIDERTYRGGSMGADHPISWYHTYDGGRAWYTAIGHTIESYSEPLFLQHLLGGINWAAGVSSQ
jgi:type 1 glutamine amidotransferase